MKIILLFVLAGAYYASAQRITTIQLDGVQYFISRMNPYSPELNYFLAYQYCRSLGLQLVSFESKEKADTMMQYLRNAGYTKYDFWTSGNKLGTGMLLWMSTGLPFNATFDYMIDENDNRHIDVPPGTEPQRVARESNTPSGSIDTCVAMSKGELKWTLMDCMQIRDFICEQTRCYYYNYGSIPVSATQGNRRPYTSGPSTTISPTTPVTTALPITTPAAPISEAPEIPAEEDQPHRMALDAENESAGPGETEEEDNKLRRLQRLPDPVEPADSNMQSSNEETGPIAVEVARAAALGPVINRLSGSKRPEHIPDITSLFTDSPINRGGPSGKSVLLDDVFAGLQTHEVRSVLRQREENKEVEDESLSEARTIGPYSSDTDPIENYQGDQPQQQVSEDESYTPLPIPQENAETSYRYNIKIRSNGKVLDPPTK